MKLNKILRRSLFLLFVSSSAAAQVADGPGYFLFPIEPGSQNYLSGTMGEIRPNHFHGGIDVKTDQREGLKVYAAADGYVSRIRMTSYGYGNIIYITHPNGKVTTYAHLREFEPTLAEYVLKNQYAQQTFDIELYPEANLFPVKKGQIIAYSGNTGGSGGPHLHFEVRDKDDNFYNPLYYQFSEVKDTTPPTIEAIALNTLSIDGRVNRKFGREQFRLTSNGNQHQIKDTISAHGLLGLEVRAYDRLDGAYNKNGTQRVNLKVNGQPVFAYHFEKIPLDRSRQVSWHINYEQLKKTRLTFQKCYVDDGNELPLYTTNSRQGKFLVQPDKLYNVELEVLDSYGNTSKLTMVLRGEKPAYFNAEEKPAKEPFIKYDLQGNILQLFAADTAKQPGNVELFRGRTKVDVLPSYTDNGFSTYLYDIRAGIPDSARICGLTKTFLYQHQIPADSDYSYYGRNMSIQFGKNSLYDTLYLIPGYEDGVWEIQDIFTPLFHPIKVTLKPETEIEDKARSAVYYLGTGRGRGYEGGTWNGNEITFTTRNLGKFAILTDEKAPTVRLLSKSSKQVRFRVGDDLSGIKEWRAEVDGKWLLLRYEHKSALLFSEQLDKSVPLSGELVLKVTDVAGNETVYKTKI